MSRELPTPPVPDLARAKGASVSELTDWFVDYYNRGGAPFNYQSATRAVRSAYRGIRRLPVLTASCAGEKTAIGRAANIDVVTQAAPLAFGREVQVFDLSPRQFPFGRERSAAYRIPFFFVENGIIHLYYLQPRKSAGLDLDEFGMIATIMKKYLLENEFFGMRCDVEFVDVSAPKGSSTRILRSYSLADLPTWSERRLTDRLTMISEALDTASTGDRIRRRPRIWQSPASDMPLFD
jgi:hypothetical protein